jgi:hypothetical protein
MVSEHASLMQRATTSLMAAGAAILFAGAAQAAPPGTTDGARATPAEQPFQSTPVSDARLSLIRGGFDLGGGLVASFGISRAVYINGNLVANIAVDIPDVSHIDSAQAHALAALVNDVTLIRNGPGNFVDPASFNRDVGAIVIQNTLNDQQIQALTTIHSTVSNLNQFNAMNLANSLQQALINSRGQ